MHGVTNLILFTWLQQRGTIPCRLAEQVNLQRSVKTELCMKNGNGVFYVRKWFPFANLSAMDL